MFYSNLYLLTTNVTFHGVGKTQLLIVQNAEIKKVVINTKQPVFK